MINVKPDFYDDFKCIADKCNDSCCIGWEIDLDAQAIEKYKKMNSLLGEEIRSCITVSEDGSQCFSLAEKEKCPFLDRDNLCRLIKEQGEDILCDICKEHPRFYNELFGVCECGLGLCCEEVCRLLLEGGCLFSLVTEADGVETRAETAEEFEEAEMYSYVSYVRREYFGILGEKGLSIEEKVRKILNCTEKSFGVKCSLRNMGEILGCYLKTDPINDEWTRFIRELYENFEVYNQCAEELDEIADEEDLYSRILAYIIYRHFINSVFDGEFEKRIAFCIEAVLFIRLCDLKVLWEKGSLKLADRIENIKNWSKQIEYSEENTELLIYGEE